MGEIDDLYKQESEDIDSAFLEEMKNTKNHKKSVSNYRLKLKRSREKFSKNYTKFNKREAKRLRNIKKKIVKMDKFKHLDISHFDFEFGFWKKLWMNLDVLFFRFMRKVKRFSSWVFPSRFIYGWYKVRNFFRYLWRDFSDFLSLKWETVKKFFMGSWNFILEILKDLWKMIKILFGKVMIWKKAKVGEEEKGEDGDVKSEGEEDGKEKV